LVILREPAKVFDAVLLPVKVPVSTSLPVLVILEAVNPPEVMDLVMLRLPAKLLEPAPVPWKESAVTDLVAVRDLERFRLPAKEFDAVELPVRVPVSTSLPVLVMLEAVSPPEVMLLVTLRLPANEEEPAPDPWNEAAVMELVAVRDLERLRLPAKELEPVPVNAMRPPL